MAGHVLGADFGFFVVRPRAAISKATSFSLRVGFAITFQPLHCGSRVLQHVEQIYAADVRRVQARSFSANAPRHLPALVSPSPARLDQADCLLNLTRQRD